MTEVSDMTDKVSLLFPRSFLTLALRSSIFWARPFQVASSLAISSKFITSPTSLSSIFIALSKSFFSCWLSFLSFVIFFSYSFFPLSSIVFIIVFWAVYSYMGYCVVDFMAISAAFAAFVFRDSTYSCSARFFFAKSIIFLSFKSADLELERASTISLYSLTCFSLYFINNSKATFDKVCPSICWSFPAKCLPSSWLL